MLKKEREGTKECIVKYRRFKRGLKKFWAVYKEWIQRVKRQRELELVEEIEEKFERIQEQEEEVPLETGETPTEEKEEVDEEQLERIKKCQPDEVQNIEEVKK